MSKISAEYKAIMNAKKQMIKDFTDEKIVDAYESEDFLIIITISKSHIIWEHSYFKLSKSWDCNLMIPQNC